MKKSSINQSSLINDNKEYNEERINNIVKASDLLNNNEIEEKNESSEDKNTKSIIKRILYPFYEQYPEMEKYAPEGKIVDITFDNEFEEKLNNKDIIELSNTGSRPELILLEIQPDSNENSFTKRIDVNDNQEKFNNIVNHYGDGNLDSLISSSIILKPSNKYDKYDIFIPTNTLTSKLKAKINKLYSTHMKRGEKQARIKFFTLNSVRAGISITQMSIILFFIYYLITFNNIPENMTTGEYFEGLIALGIILILGIFCLHVISLCVYKKSNSGNQFGGAFELGIYIYLKDFYKYLYTKFMNMNETLGKLIKIN